MKKLNLFSSLLSVGVIALSGAMVAPVLAAEPKTDPAATPATTPADSGMKKDKKEKKDKKDKQEAAKLKIGDTAPEFKLTDTDGKEIKLSDYKGKVVIIEWFNPECPAITQHHEKAKTFNDMATAFKGKDVVMLAINSSASGKQGHGKDKNAKAKKDFGMEYPILLDESGEVGKSFGATNTPHCFVIDKDGKLAYQGAIDNGKFGKNGDKNYVKQAAEQLLKGETVTEPEVKAYGCSVKYKD